MQRVALSVLLRVNFGFCLGCSAFGGYLCASMSASECLVVRASSPGTVL